MLGQYAIELTRDEAACGDTFNDPYNFYTGATAHAVHAASAFRRYRISRLEPSGADSTHTSPTAVALFDKILRERLLPLISRELPKLEDYMWSRSADGPNTSTPLNKRTATKLSSLPFRYAPQEPAINRYAKGGAFDQHTDQEALTLNILLSDGGAFEGGGTGFWRDDVAAETVAETSEPGRERGETIKRGPPSVKLQPAAGVGVVFSGNVYHCGLAVTAGLRHVLVASFSIANPE